MVAYCPYSSGKVLTILFHVQLTKIYKRFGERRKKHCFVAELLSFSRKKQFFKGILMNFKFVGFFIYAKPKPKQTLAPCQPQVARVCFSFL